ncbi:P-loop NTPase fold protein [Nocardioides kribbensis]|uniref:P-loop NTPase fold protein n=1 Tax=Nocardioides kribbensis TaxID=305517 RepID=UPI0018797377|nr:P-loop NTPase fold protein [Nocardioides kribbensis]
MTTTWADEPLISSCADTLDRKQYAGQAAELIASTHSPDSSVVFGLAGAWGSGKTSVVNMLVEHLKKHHKQWVVARFTPWATSDITGLLSEFHAAVSEALPKKRGKAFTRALATTAGLAAPVANVIPVAGAAAADVVKAGAERLTRDPSWQKAFNDAASELRKLRIPVLVVVDDIDRLHGDELAALLKVVRLLGRFDGMSYLLAYDEDTLLRTVVGGHFAGPGAGVAGPVAGSVTWGGSRAESDAAATLFLEKIVQYPLTVPPLLKHQAVVRLNAGLAPILTARGGTRRSSDPGRLPAMVECFTDLLRTPRAIDRYVAQVRHHLPLLDVGEIDDDDVQLLLLLRVAVPQLYHQLPRYKDRLVSGGTGQLEFESPDLAMQKFNPAPLLERVPADQQQSARLVLGSLFPKVTFTGHYGTYASETGVGVRVEDYFDRYFAMGIVTHDVRDSDAREAVQAAAAGDASPLVRLLTGQAPDATPSPGGPAITTTPPSGPIDPSRQMLALRKCMHRANQPSTDPGQVLDKARIRLASSIVTTIALVPEEHGSMFSAHSQLLRWLASTIAGLDDNQPAVDIIALAEPLDVSTRMRLWRDTEQAMPEVRRNNTAPSWAGAVETDILDRAVAAIIDNLTDGDYAPEALGIGFVLHSALSRNRVGELRQKIQAVIATGAVTLETLASRLVGIHGSVGVTTTWYLATDEFDQSIYDQLAPPGDDPWYHQEVVDVDASDLTWSNRRAFVRGRVTPPPNATTAPESEPDDGQRVEPSGPAQGDEG